MHIYVKSSGNDINLIGLYVDDMVLACSSMDNMKMVINHLNQHVEAVDRGPVSFYLGMQIERESDRGAISIHQMKYVERLLEKWNMTNCNSSSTIATSGTVLKKCIGECTEPVYNEYQSLIGELMYLAVISRPDIAHIVAKLSQFNSHAHREHFLAAKHVLRYLKGHPKGIITFSPNQEKLVCFTDADWGSDSTDRKSFSGSVLLLAGGAIAWESKKQNVVALSSMEAEYIAMCQGAKEVAFHRSLLLEMGFKCVVPEPTTIWYDNQGAQFLANNPSTHKRSKHIDIRFHFIRDKCLKGELVVKYVASSENIADIFTKSLNKESHLKCCNLLKLKI